jgi:hypothetical protein
MDRDPEFWFYKAARVRQAERSRSGASLREVADKHADIKIGQIEIGQIGILIRI